MGRLLQFRRELALLWTAFMSPATPVWLKGAMLLVPAYLLSPIDLIPDFIPIAGWLDDLIVIPLLVSWLVSRIPQPVRTNRAETRQGTDKSSAPIIDGDYHRL